MQRKDTMKVLKLGHLINYFIIVLKMEQIIFSNVMVYPKDADGMANKEDLDQTAP